MTKLLPETEFDTDLLLERFGVDDDMTDERIAAAQSVIHAMIEVDELDGPERAKWQAMKQLSIVLDFLLDDPEMPDWIDVRVTDDEVAFN